MRQHVLRNKEKIIKENIEYIAEDPKNLKGRWKEIFPFEGPLYIEIGSGKGQFISTKASLDPKGLYLACEGAVNVYPRILQKAGSMNLKNLKLIREYIIDPLDYFEKGELSAIYINFCDPWPKDRHAHRRLTHVSKLLAFKEIMKEGSFLEFKTDNDELFDFSLEQTFLAGLKADRVVRDLHASDLAECNVKTEYEEKFSSAGKSINYLRIVF